MHHRVEEERRRRTRVAMKKSKHLPTAKGSTTGMWACKIGLSTDDRTECMIADMAFETRMSEIA